MFTIEKQEDKYIATFVQEIHSAKKSVWDILTVNSQLKKWFSELEIETLQVGGRILFDMQDETYEMMEILEVETESVFSYTWDRDAVKFILEENNGITTLTFIETINNRTNHTSRDLAGWHCCMVKIKDLLEGTETPLVWEEFNRQYMNVLNKG